MSSRSSSHVRTKVVALIVSMAALWAFAAFVTLREGLNLLWVSTVNSGIGEPSELLVPALQQERRLSLVYLGGHGSAQRELMVAQRLRTDEVRTRFEELARAGTVQLAISPTSEQRLNQTFERLNELAEARAAIDAGRVDRFQAAAAFTNVLDSIFHLYGSLAEFDDKEIAKDIRTLIALFRAREVLAQEDALIAGVLAGGAFRGTEHGEFVRLVGAQRFLHAEAAAELPATDRGRYEQLVGGTDFARYRAVEDRLIQNGRAGEPLPVTDAEWNSAIEPVISDLEHLSVTGGDEVVERATPVGIAVVVRLALAGLLGLAAVIASIIISITTARSLIRQLERLRNAARDLAAYRLPFVVDRLQRGEKVDVEHDAPPLDFGKDEIGQVGEAFNEVQRTAIQVAAEQAELRRSVRDVFLSLARRNQALLHRQLGMLDVMERRTTDAEELSELFRVDHLATRMRRNAENLIVLSGASPGRAWRKPVPMIDVIRGALAEVEDYARVSVLPVGSALLEGRAVGDVIHLLAELIENAVSFSPPQTVVRVGGSIVGNGFAVEIEDRGLGMSDADREAANEQLRNPPEFKLTSTARLGLYVVGRLAERHGIRVQLTESPYGGTTAVVVIPVHLVVDEPTDEIGLVDDWKAPTPAAIGPGHARHAHEPRDPRKRDRRDSAAISAGTAVVDQTRTEADLPVFDELVAAGLRRDGTTEVPPVPRQTPPEAAEPTRSEPILTPSGLPWRQKPGPNDAPRRDTGDGGHSPPGSDTATVTIAGSATAEALEEGHPVAATKPAIVSMDEGTSTVTAAPDAAMSVGAEDEVTGGVEPQRRAEEMRSLWSSYRSGTLRGRTDAARTVGSNEPTADIPTPSIPAPRIAAASNDMANDHSAHDHAANESLPGSNGNAPEWTAQTPEPHRAEEGA